MGRLLDLLKSAAGEISLHSPLGKWAQAVSQLESADAIAVFALQTAVAALQALEVQDSANITALQLNTNSFQTVYPLGTGADDWAPLNPILNTDAYTRQVVMMPITTSGVRADWQCLSQQVWPSGSSVTTSAPGVVVEYDCRPVGAGSEAATPIYRDIQPAVTTTLAALGVVGARTITVASAAALAIGGRILLEDPGKVVRGYQIEDIAGVVVTLDAPLPYPFPNGTSTVTNIPLASQCRDIRIKGNGLKFQPKINGIQLVDKVIELLAAWDCVIEDLVIDSGGAALMGVSYDMGGVRNTWRRIVQNGQGNSQNGIALEGNRDGLITECSTRDNALCGVDLGSCTNCNVEKFESDHDYYGIYLNGLAGDVYGCTGCNVKGTVRNSVSSAVAVGFGSAYNTFEVNTENCQAGIEFGAFTGAASHHNTAKNSTLRGGNNGLITLDGSHDNILESCELVDQTGANAYLQSGPVTFVNTVMQTGAAGSDAACQIGLGVVVYCNGLTQEFNGGADTNGRFYFVGNGSTLIGSRVRSVQNANKAAGTYVVFALSAGGAPVMDVGDVEVTFFDNTTGVRSVYVAGTAKVRINNYKQTNGYCAFGFLTSTCSIQIDGTLDINNIGAGGLCLFEAGGATQAQCNVGSFTGTGAPQDVAIPQIAANSVVRIWKPGGVLLEVAYTITPATKITLTVPGGQYFWQLIT